MDFGTGEGAVGEGLRMLWDVDAVLRKEGMCRGSAADEGEFGPSGDAAKVKLGPPIADEEGIGPPGGVSVGGNLWLQVSA